MSPNQKIKEHDKIVFHYQKLTLRPQALEWFCSTIALTFVLARLWVRLTQHQYQFHGAKLWVSDLLLVAGLACAFGCAACDTFSYQLGTMLDFSNPNLHLGQVRKMPSQRVLRSLFLDMS